MQTNKEFHHHRVDSPFWRGMYKVGSIAAILVAIKLLFGQALVAMLVGWGGYLAGVHDGNQNISISEMCNVLAETDAEFETCMDKAANAMFSSSRSSIKGHGTEEW